METCSQCHDVGWYYSDWLGKRVDCTNPVCVEMRKMLWVLRAELRENK